MSTNDVLITPGSGEVKWVDSGGSDFVRIIGDAGATNTITFVGDDNTANGVIFQDHATDVFYPATSGLNLGVSANRWNLFATAGDFSGAITTATNLTLSGASSTITINGASAAINMGGSAGLFTLSSGSSILLSGATSSITLTGLSSVLTLAGVTGTNLAPLKFTTGSAPATSVAGQMWWTGSANLQFAKTNGTASTFAFTDTDLSTFTVGILGVARGGTGTGTTFTLGSVVFAGASGVYTQDNANFFWDDTNNRLGIGTASPTSDLSLGGATAARTIALERKTSGAGSNLTIRSGGAQSGATDTAGGTLILSSGITTGQGFSYVDIYTYGDETVISGSSDNSSMPVARFGGAGVALGTTTIGSGLNLTLNSNVGVTPWTYVIGLPDSTSIGGNALTIKSGNATTASNISGGTLALVAGNATGTGSSSITFSTATAGGTGAATRASSVKMTLTGDGQLQVSTTGSSAGILIGGDANLYRSAADTLKTDDSLIIASNLTVNSLTTTRVPFASTSGLLIDSANFTYTTGTGQLALATTGSGAGILIGGDANLYRSAADTLKTDDAFVSGSTITGASSLTLGANGGTTGSVLIRGTTSGTVTMTVAAVAGTWSFTLPTTAGSSGQYLQTDGAGVTSWQTLTGGLTWASNASSPISAVASNGYIANLGTLLTYNLPTPAVGSIIEIVGLGAGGWKAQCASTHTIRMGTIVSAATGYAASTNQYDSIRMVGVSSTQWQIISAVGTIDIV